MQGAYCPSVVVLYPTEVLDPPQESVVPVVVEEGEDLGDLQGAIARRVLMCSCVRDDGGSDIVQRGLESLSDRASGRLHPGSSSPRWSSLPSRPHSLHRLPRS